LPELPEIEHLCTMLRPRLLGATVRSVRIDRADVVRSHRGRRAAPSSAAMLAGDRIVEIRRHGKQFALIGAGGPVVAVHLGMSGGLRHDDEDETPPAEPHVHVRWRLERDGRSAVLSFRDPRRFGGLWAIPSVDALLAGRWSELGPDALGIDAAALRSALRRTRRPIKAALLDQRLVAGLGNIYVDECLHAAGVHPLRRTDRLPAATVERLHVAIGQILRAAAAAGGSTLRDYLDAAGAPGGYGRLHAVYGRTGQPCPRCGRPIVRLLVAQRSSHVCPRCQRRPPVPRARRDGRPRGPLRIGE